MDQITKYLWIVFIIAGVGNAFALRSRSKRYTFETPELEEGYNKIFIGMIVFFTIPWAIIGIGTLSGSVKGIHDIFRPRDMNPYVLLFHVCVISFVVLSNWWVFFNNGAAFLAKHPGVMQKRSFLSGSSDLTERDIKIFVPLASLGSLVAEVMMWTIDFPAPKF